MLMAVDVDDPSTVTLKAIAEPLRWRILQLLGDEELCVCHLVDELQVAQPLISHHLRVLREAGLVESSRHRYWTYYRLRPDGLRDLAGAVAGLAGSAPPPGDRRRPCC
jgi:ArsR family transcriptional regulator, arsenate/arsenite/antimonite-responsive transcriptional repressor